MLDYLINFVNHLGHWGYLVIFLVVALECQALLGLVMPGESLVIRVMCWEPPQRVWPGWHCA